MPLESASFITDLNESNPAAGDTVSQSDDHLRLIKSALKSTFPNMNAAVTITPAALNGLVARLDALEAANYVGRVTWNAGATLPPRHLLCAGQAVSRTVYSALFASLQTSHGPGDGTSTFNLPDLRGRVPAGLDNMGGTDANRMSVIGAARNTLGGVGGSQNIQAHSHSLTDPGHGHGGSAGGAGHHSHTGYTDFQGDHQHGTGGQGGQGGGISSGTSWGNSNNYILSGGGTDQFFSSTAGNHQHNIQTYGAGDHTHSIFVSPSTTGITIASHGSGTSENIPPVAFGNYVIFTGV
jgi:hypothetical protein